MKFKLILPIGEVDAGETVTKPGGAQEFIVMEKSIIQGNKDFTSQEVMCLMCRGPTIYAKSPDTPVALTFDSWVSLRDFAEYKIQ